MTTNPKHIIAEIAVWTETKTTYETAYNNALKYDDRGSKEFAEEMIRYSQQRINELEHKLTLARKGGAA